MKQPKTIIKYLVNDPRICFEMTLSVPAVGSKPASLPGADLRGHGYFSSSSAGTELAGPRDRGDVFARQGAGRSRDEARGAGTGLAGDAGARGREGGGIAAASSLPRAEALGIIGGEFSERNEGKKKRKKILWREMVGAQPRRGN